MRLPNLEAEIKRNGESVEAFAHAVGLERATLYNRLNGSTPWTLPNMLAVQSYLAKNGAELSLDYLFKVEL